MDDPPLLDAATLARWSAAQAGLDLPAECAAGVAENLALLADHVRRIDAKPR